METDYLVSPSQIFLVLYNVHFSVKESEKVAREWISYENSSYRRRAAFLSVKNKQKLKIISSVKQKIYNS